MRLHSLLSLLPLFCLPVITLSAAAASPRQADVAARGAEVMPFDLQATSPGCTQSRNGGLPLVLVKDPKDAVQLRLVRSHLREISARFEKGDFSAPAQIHGQAMPGLAQLKQAKPGEITVHYRDLFNGAQLRYATSNPALVPVLHQWFDAQLADHGADAMEGHAHHGGHAH